MKVWSAKAEKRCWLAGRVAGRDDAQVRGEGDEDGPRGGGVQRVWVLDEVHDGETQ